MKKICLIVSTVLICNLASAQIPTSGLVARYTFNNNTNDTTINGNDMGPVNGNGGLNYVPGINGAAVNFAQGGNCEILERTSVTGLTDGSFSISIWLNIEDSVNGTPVTIAVGRNNISNFPTFALESYHSGVNVYTQFYLYHDFTYTAYQVSSFIVPTDEWHMVTFVYNAGDSLYSYMDGVILSGFAMATVADTLNDVTSKLNMGAPSSYCNSVGSTDEFLIYNRALNETEVAQIYNAQFQTMGVQNEVPENQNISVYPNPSSDYIQFNWKGITDISKIELVTMDGKVLHTYHSQIPVMSTSDLQSGLYVIRMYNNDQVFTSKFIKQ